VPTQISSNSAPEHATNRRSASCGTRYPLAISVIAERVRSWPLDVQTSGQRCGQNTLPLSRRKSPRAIRRLPSCATRWAPSASRTASSVATSRSSRSSSRKLSPRSAASTLPRLRTLAPTRSRLPRRRLLRRRPTALGLRFNFPTLARILSLAPMPGVPVALRPRATSAFIMRVPVES
jgi:hypothetical protein